MESELNIPIVIVSVGPDRKETLLDSKVKKFFLVSIILLVFCFYTKILAQEKTKIKIERAGFFEKDKNKFPDASVLTRDKDQKVLISHDGVLMTCNQAFFTKKEILLRLLVKFH